MPDSGGWGTAVLPVMLYCPSTAHPNDQTANDDPQPQVLITIAGMSNGLGGVVAGSSVHPVITCPPAQSLEEFQVDLNSSLRMPSDVPVMTVLHPKNAALSAVRILSEGDETLRAKVKARIEEVKEKY